MRASQNTEQRCEEVLTEARKGLRAGVFLLERANDIEMFQQRFSRS